MFIELHMIQNFAPSNLNRDDNGSPKNCDFGGVRRARVSSQCLKRATREAFKQGKLLPPERLAERTKLAVNAVAARLVTAGHQEAESRAVAELAFRGAGLDVNEGKTQYLLFLGAGEMNAIAALCHQHWGELSSVAMTGDSTATGKARKQAGRDALSKDITTAIRERLNGGKAADVALFGRMLADLPELNIEAASQVAHAVSTHGVSVEFDFYTAVDDLQTRAETGAGMMGTVEFNSACFYRYMNVDLEQLRRNLGGDEELALRTVEAYLHASILAIPTGKQNSMAAQNLPSFVMVVARDRGLWSLANAFAKPVRVTERDDDLISGSIRRLDEQWGKLTRMYGTDGILGVRVAQEDNVQLPHLIAPPLSQQVASIKELTQAVKQLITAGVTV